MKSDQDRHPRRWVVGWLAAALVVTAAVAGVVATMSAGTTDAAKAATDTAGTTNTSLRGPELAAALGLDLLAEKPKGCDDWIVVALPSSGYCIEDVDGPSDWEKRELGLRLAGSELSPLDKQILVVQEQIANLDVTSGSSAQREDELARLTSELANLNAQKQAASDDAG